MLPFIGATRERQGDGKPHADHLNPKLSGARVCRGHIGTMENKMEATVL